MLPPLALQVTAVLAAPEVLPVNCRVWLKPRLPLVGLMVTTTGCTTFTVMLVEPTG